MLKKLDVSISLARQKHRFVSNLNADWLEMEYYLRKSCTYDHDAQFTMTRNEFIEMWKSVATEKRLTGFGQVWCNCSRGNRRSSDPDMNLTPKLEAPPAIS